MTMSWLRPWVVGLACTLFFGCAPTVTVSVTGSQQAAAPIPSQVTYALFPTAEVEEDPAFSRYARVVAEKMNERGHKETDARTAKLAVYLGYGIQEASAATVATGGGPPVGGTGGMGSAGAGQYGTGISSPGSASLVKRYVGQAVIVVGDLPKSRAAGALAESWRGEAMSVGDNDLSGMMPLLVEGAFRHFGRTASGPAQVLFGEEELTKLRAAK